MSWREWAMFAAGTLFGVMLGWLLFGCWDADPADDDNDYIAGEEDDDA